MKVSDNPGLKVLIEHQTGWPERMEKPNTEAALLIYTEGQDSRNSHKILEEIFVIPWTGWDP